MSAEVLTLRDLDAPSTAVAVKPDTALAPAPVTIKSAVLALFRPMEAELQALAKRHEKVAYDLSTPKGLTIAKAARHELRESGRFAVQRLRDKTKEQLNDGKKVVEAEADRLIAIVKPAEDTVHEQIEAREKVLADEKAERDRIEAERRKKHADAIAVIRGYVELARGKSSEKIEAGIAYVQTIDVSAEWFEEFALEAEQAKTETWAALRHMRDAALRDEADTAERERQRVENARVAAELAEQRRKLDAEAAEVRRQAAEVAAQKAALEAPITEALDVALRYGSAMAQGARVISPSEFMKADTPEQDSQHVLKAEAEGPDATDRERPAHASSSPMSECFAFTKYAAAPFFSERVRVVDADGAITYIQPTTQEWWEGLHDDIERLQPLLEQAIAAREAA